MDFNEKLREYRTQSGLSQGKLAETLNVSRTGHNKVGIGQWNAGYFKFKGPFRCIQCLCG